MATNTSIPNARARESARAALKTSVFARYFPVAARVLLGLFLLASGVTGLLHLTPAPPPNLPAAAVAFNTGLSQSGFMMPLIFGTQTLVALLLLVNRFVPLALALLAPFLVCSLAFHLFLVPQGLIIVAVLMALELYLAWSYRTAFLPMLSAKVSPGAK